MAEEQKKQQNFVRIYGTDINSERTLLYGLAKIKGVSYMYSNALCHFMGLDRQSKISELSDKDIDRLEKVLSGDEKVDIPAWLKNNRRNLETGEDKHISGKDIEFDLLTVKRRLSKIKTYRGLRLRHGLTVRGQRTKSNFRRNKTLAAMKSKSVGGKR